MVPKPSVLKVCVGVGFRAVLFRMVPKLNHKDELTEEVLELCCFEWFQNKYRDRFKDSSVLELCCFEWFQNSNSSNKSKDDVLELCCFEWFQN